MSETVLPVDTQTRPAMTIDEILKEDGMPADPLPPAPPWHVDDRHNCGYGWIAMGEQPHWLACNCENPADLWPARVPGDGPRDCQCFGCEGHEPRWERGKLKECEYKDHHCENCHEHRHCTIPACGFGS